MLPVPDGDVVGVVGRDDPRVRRVELDLHDLVARRPERPRPQHRGTVSETRDLRRRAGDRRRIAGGEAEVRDGGGSVSESRDLRWRTGDRRRIAGGVGGDPVCRSAVPGKECGL